MDIVNKTKSQSLVTNVIVPKTMRERMRGLLGRDSLETGSGMLFYNCGWVHTFFMRFEIDLVFISRDHRVVHTNSALKPNRFSKICLGASMTLELPAGVVAQTGTEVGDKLQFNVSPLSD